MNRLLVFGKLDWCTVCELEPLWILIGIVVGLYLMLLMAKYMEGPPYE